VHFSTATLIELAIVLIILVIPRALQRFRLPAQLTCFFFGVLISIFYKPLSADRGAEIMATMGIASLFLLAGLEVDVAEIRRDLRRICLYLVFFAAFLIGIAMLAMRFLHLGWQAALLLGLGIMTPSAGFIFDNLPNSGLDEEEQSEVTINAISAEVVALLVLFLVSQAGSAATLGISSIILLALIVVTPFFFLFLGKHVVPYASGSEFSLLLLAGIVCAVITQNIGVHYLIGAFIAGLVAGLLRTRLATLASSENLHAIRLFASFFIPFYFFHEGMQVPADSLVWPSLIWGAGICIIAIPIRLAKTWLQARFISGRTAGSAFRISLSLVPTLIFTLVIAEILRSSFHINDELYGGLLIYAAVTTILPSLILPGLRITEAGDIATSGESASAAS